MVTTEANLPGTVPQRRGPDEPTVGEYNGKFMCNQVVLRGGSCATSRTHIRPTHRNCLPPEATWNSRVCGVDGRRVPRPQQARRPRRTRMLRTPASRG
jgi:formylglycine-generating enzyme required for sulfatase activity